MTKTSSAIASVTLAAGIVLLATGCVSTFKEVKPLSGGAPPATKPSAVVLGEVKIADARLSQPEKEQMTDAFEHGFAQWCGEKKSFAVLKQTVGTNLPPGSLMVEGTITEIEKGSAAARFWVGMGAGQQRAVGEFVVRGLDGTNLTAFTARKSYLGGSGIGGWDMLKLEDLIDQLGQLVAETTDKWARGAKIN